MRIRDFHGIATINWTYALQDIISIDCWHAMAIPGAYGAQVTKIF
jgi:hypothetical protein